MGTIHITIHALSCAIQIEANSKAAWRFITHGERSRQIPLRELKQIVNGERSLHYWVELLGMPAYMYLWALADEVHAYAEDLLADVAWQEAEDIMHTCDKDYFIQIINIEAPDHY